MQDTQGIRRYQYPALTRLFIDWTWLPMLLVSLAGGIYLLFQNDMIAYALSLVFLVIFPTAVLQSIGQSGSITPSKIEIEGSSVRLRTRFAHRELTLTDITELEEGVTVRLLGSCSGATKVHYNWLGKPTYFYVGPHMNDSSELVEFLRARIHVI